MLPTEIYEHQRLTPEMAALFLQADAICYFFSNTFLGRLLSQLQIPKEGFARWDYDAVQLLRKQFTFKNLYNVSFSVRNDYRHELCVEASQNTRLIEELCRLLNNLKRTSVVDKQWYFLSFYLNTFPESAKPIDFNAEQTEAVAIESLHYASFDVQWFQSRNPFIRKCLVRAMFVWILRNGRAWESAGAILSALEDDEHLGPDELFDYGLFRMLQGKPWRCHSTNALSGEDVTDLDCIELFLHGQYDDCYQRLLKIANAWGAEHHLRKFKFIPGILGVVFYICRFRLNIDMDSFFEDCWSVLRTIGNNRESKTYEAFQHLYIRKYHSDAGVSPSNRFYFQIIQRNSLVSVFGRFICYHAALAAKKDGWQMDCLELRNALSACPVAFNILNDILREVNYTDLPNQDVEYIPWIDLARGTPLWEKQLSNLKRIFGQPEAGEKKRRLVWLARFDSYFIVPYVQVMLSGGRWSQGKQLPWSQIRDPKQVWITEQDREIFSAFDSVFSFLGHGDLFFNSSRGIPQLAGHPLIFDHETREPLTLERRKVMLSIKDEHSQCQISLNCRPEHGDICLDEEEPGKWVVYCFTRTLKALDEILGDNGMIMPTTELPTFLDVLRNVKDLDLDVQAKTPRLPGHPEPVVQLWQQGNLFLAQIRVRPAGENKEGTLFIPGEGKADVLQVLNGRTVTIVRELDKEIELSHRLITSCPSLSAIDETLSWAADDLEHFFELICELKACEVPISIEWPEGEKFKLLGKVKSNQIALHTRQKGDWFSLSGEVKVNELKVLELSELLERTNGKSRFVELKNGDFLQLSDDVRRSLERLRLFTSRRAGKERQVHPLAGALVDDLCEGMEHDSDVNWNEMVSKMRTAFELKPELPATLQAELRPYQMTGFVWLCRLSEWGVGGCLADDMGLGKTIQAIAVMLREAQKGPCLIIAPTSVCPNWVDELHRFAPSLQVVRLRDAEDRKQMVESMEKGMVMVTGYGLLPRESEILSTQQWQMVVFDEAQALKNSATQRSRAAHTISAHFPLALTGTPIENHLEDLWSVFNIINPGLLGSLQDFHRRFGNASEGGASAAALKMLIRPFILRRLKSQVLDDLPDLTEQTIIIEPTKKEAEFYESIRRNALKHVSEGPQASGQKRFSILAELTRLRRACCHASLADPQGAKFVEPVSSKLVRFLELLEEARSGGHRLLVFSQFTGHLALVRAELDKAKIPYQYLDGSTPEERRRQSVAAFQRGEGDAFLISLKAGGQGLNLTAADYVVHLDPWWNPAVEDQATDRAHRIGQKNTVTVYRLVMAHSVEEKILSLHARKRDLAADFLEGSEEAVTSATLSEEELLALLQ